MARSRSGRAARRADARWWRRTAPQRRLQRRHRLQRGQSLVIFAISLTVLMGVVGLAIDVLRAYDLYGREHRAAEAAALAGVLYMPNFYNTVYTTTPIPGVTTAKSAISEALQLTYNDGFGDGMTAPSSCTAPNTSMEVTVCKADPSLGIQSDTALQVTITEPIDVFFLSLVGINSITVSATSAADFLPGLDLGSTNPNDPRSYYWSDGGECNNKPVPPPSCSGGLHDFASAINGPAELKQSGDPYVNCEEGPSYSTTPDVSAATGPLVSNAYTGILTNHPQNPSPNCGTANPDQQPGGFAGPETAGTSHPGAHNYFIQAPQLESVWVFNPSYVPTEPSSCNGYQLPDQFEQDLSSCTTYYTKYSSPGDSAGVPYSPGNWNDPRLYFQVTYTLYSVPVLYDRTGDQEWACPPPATTPPSISCQPQIPYDAMGGNPCGGTGNIYSLPTPSQPSGSCVSGASANQNGWVKVADDIGPSTGNLKGLYRLAVEATAYDPFSATDGGACGLFNCGWGVHAYGIKLCPDKYAAPNNVDGCWGSPPPAGTSIRPWNNVDVILLFNNANLTNQIPLADLPANFAGRTITVSVFNPGISHGHSGNIYFLLNPPLTSDTGQTNPPIPISTGPPTTTPGIYYPTWLRTASFPGSVGTGLLSVQTSARTGGSGPGDGIYHGLWITATVVLPPGYLGGQWWLNVYNDAGKDFNEFTASFSLAGGSPIHIIL